MDTRSKILTIEAAGSLRLAPLVVVTGYFDLLRADHPRELASIRRRTGAAALLVAVLPWDRALLNQRARSEMVAALRMVDYVVSIDDRDLPGLIAALQPVELVRLEATDACRARELTEHVRRQKF